MAQAELSKLSGIKPRYFASELPVDSLLWVLSGGDALKAAQIENLEVGFCYDWYYNLKVKELNEMIFVIEERKRSNE